jgi:DNA-binding XRE family transcriptional regulator
VITRDRLEAHFDTVDEILGVINETEAILDGILLGSNGAKAFEAPPVIPMSLPSIDSARSESALARDVAEHIKAARKKRGWRQKDLAEATGIARPNIARLESGRRMPKITTLSKISHALGVSVETLLGLA